MTQPTSTDNDHERERGFRTTGYRWMAAGLLGVAVVLLLMSSTHVRIAIKSAVFLNEVFPDAPAYPARWFSDEPHRRLVQFQHEGRYHGAFLYHPAEPGCYGGIVMYIGLGPEYGDRHLDRISRAFARNGTTVLVPFSEAMVDFRLDMDEHEVAASAFEYLRSYPEVDPDRVGMFGISVGGSVVVNAAQEDAIADQVAMVHSLGGYYDALDLLAQISVRAYHVDGEWEEWEPSDATIRATRNFLMPLLPSDDRVALWDMFGEDLTDIPDDLTEDGEALARLLANRDPEKMDELIAALPPEISGYLAEISPSHNLERLTADTYLLHDRYDHVLPYSESIRLADEARELGHDRVYLTIIEQFHHVRPDEEGDRLSLLGDGLRLYGHIFRMHQSMDDRGWLTSPLDLLPFFGGSTRCD